MLVVRTKVTGTRKSLFPCKRTPSLWGTGEILVGLGHIPSYRLVGVPTICRVDIGLASETHGIRFSHCSECWADMDIMNQHQEVNLTHVISTRRVSRRQEKYFSTKPSGLQFNFLRLDRDESSLAHPWRTLLRSRVKALAITLFQGIFTTSMTRPFPETKIRTSAHPAPSQHLIQAEAPCPCHLHSRNRNRRVRMACYKDQPAVRRDLPSCRADHQSNLPCSRG